MNIKKTYILFYILAGYVTLQFIWWAYLLVNLNLEVSELQQSVFTQSETNYEQIANRKIWMIVGEGSVFLILLLIGYEAIRRSIAKQFNLAMQQNNFLLAVTHELKTPIASVKLLLQTTQKRELPKEKNNELINKALVETERLSDLTENILVATRLGQKAYQINTQQINITNWLQDFFAHQKERNNHKNNSLKLSVEPNNEVLIYADLLALDSIFGNLLENAFKYAEPGSPITLKLKKALPNTVEISIHNFGEPISYEDQKQIFDMFFRAGNEQTRKTKGTGLGLYIVKKLVDLHKGKVSVTSSVKEGTKFQVTLPCQMHEELITA
jgi:signal transduction histidine kinase